MNVHYLVLKGNVEVEERAAWSVEAALAYTAKTYPREGNVGVRVVAPNGNTFTYCRTPRGVWKEV